MKGCSSARKRRAAIAVAGHRPRLDQRRALPVLPDGLVIGQRRRDRDRQRRRARVRAQPQIGAKNVAIAGALVENAHEIARERGRTATARGPARAPPGSPGRREGSGRYRSNSSAPRPPSLPMPSTIRPLPGSGSAGSTGAIAPLAAAARSRWRSAAPIAASAKRLSAAIWLFERPASGQLGDRREQRDAAPGDAQRAHQRSAILAAVLPALRSRRAISSKGRVGPLVDQPGQKIPFGDRDARQERDCCRTARPAACAPSGVPLQARALGNAGLGNVSWGGAIASSASASAAFHADRPSSSSRRSAGSGRMSRFAAIPAETSDNSVTARIRPRAIQPRAERGGNAFRLPARARRGSPPVAAEGSAPSRAGRPSRYREAARHLARSTHRLLRWCGAIIAALILIVLVAAWRLMQGPIDLNFLAPYVEAALDRAGIGIGVRLSGMRLGIDPASHELGLRADNVRVAAPDGYAAGAFPADLDGRRARSAARRSGRPDLADRRASGTASAAGSPPARSAIDLAPGEASPSGVVTGELAPAARLRSRSTACCRRNPATRRRCRIMSRSAARRF